MLRELFGFCLPLLLSSPLIVPDRVRPTEGAAFNWVDWMMKTYEEFYMRLSGMYGGKVIALTEDSITVHRRGTWMPRRFSLAPAMLSDRIPLIRGPGIGHRLKDVRIGDMVSLEVSPIHDGFVCYAMGVVRRPGGKIPPAEDGYLPEHCRMHNIYNAHQFAEERVIPSLPRIVRSAAGRFMK